MKKEMTNKLTMELYESPMKERNEKKYGLRSRQCICCGKLMKDNENLYVHMNTDWLAVNPSIPEELCEKLTGAGSQGCFPIGNGCAKKMVGFAYNPYK